MALLIHDNQNNQIHRKRAKKNGGFQEQWRKEDREPVNESRVSIFGEGQKDSTEGRAAGSIPGPLPRPTSSDPEHRPRSKP